MSGPTLALPKALTESLRRRFLPQRNLAPICSFCTFLTSRMEPLDTPPEIHISDTSWLEGHVVLAPALNSSTLVPRPCQLSPAQATAGHEAAVVKNVCLPPAENFLSRLYCMWWTCPVNSQFAKPRATGQRRTNRGRMTESLLCVQGAPDTHLGGQNPASEVQLNHAGSASGRDRVEFCLGDCNIWGALRECSGCHFSHLPLVCRSRLLPASSELFFLSPHQPMLGTGKPLLGPKAQCPLDSSSEASLGSHLPVPAQSLPLLNVG